MQITFVTFEDIDFNIMHHQLNILLRKIALPYPHKCLLGFVEAKRGDQQEYLKIILVREVNPVVSDRCACAQHIVGWTLSRDLHSIFGRRGGNTWSFFNSAPFQDGRCVLLEFIEFVLRRKKFKTSYSTDLNYNISCWGLSNPWQLS